MDSYECGGNLEYIAWLVGKKKRIKIKKSSDKDMKEISFISR